MNCRHESNSGTDNRCGVLWRPDWIEQELVASKLPDARLERRLRYLVEQLAKGVVGTRQILPDPDQPVSMLDLCLPLLSLGSPIHIVRGSKPILRKRRANSASYGKTQLPAVAFGCGSRATALKRHLNLAHLRHGQDKTTKTLSCLVSLEFAVHCLRYRLKYWRSRIHLSGFRHSRSPDSIFCSG